MLLCGGGSEPPSNGTFGHPHSDDLAGSDILSPGEQKLCILMQQFSKDFKKGENVTSVLNPKDPSLCMLLNTACIRIWANDWANDVPGVDEMNPPTKRPGFRWISVSNYENKKNDLLGLRPAATDNLAGSSSGTVVHHNYYGQPFPSPGFSPAQPLGFSQFPPPYSLGHTFPSPVFSPNPIPPAVPFLASGGHIPPPYPNPTPSASATESLRLSPPPSIPNFEEFLIFAGIKPEMTKTREILANQGIDNFGRLLDCKTYTFDNFRSMGIPFAHADDITKAVPDFNRHLKSQCGS